MSSFISGKQPTQHCLQNYIGLRGCGITMPDSAAYVNELPGISLKTIDNIADSEQLNFNGVWHDIQARALRKFDTDVQNYLGKKHKLNSPLETINLGFGLNIDPSDQTAPSANYRGIYAEINYGSQLQVIHVQEVTINTTSYSTNGALYFFELADDGNVYKLLGLTVAPTPNANTFYIGKDFTAKKLLIVYDQQNVTVPKTTIDNAYNSNSSCCNIQLSGVTLSQNTQAPVVTKGQNTFGVSAVLSVRCNWGAFVCNNKSLFTQSLLLLYGIELMNERIHSQRLNQYTLFGADKAKQLRDELIAQYQQELDSVLSTAHFGTDCCVACNDVVTFKERRP